VANDQVFLNVDTSMITVGSAGKNTFVVAYDPNSGRSYVAAYQNPILIQPMNSNQVPFTLGSGQQVEVNSNGIGPITTIGQTTGGSTYVSPNGKDMYGPVGGTVNTQPSGMAQGGCYKDPMTGTITCVDSNGNPINTQSGSKTNQPEPSSSVPYSLHECENGGREICGTWTLQGNQYYANWENGATATLTVDSWGASGVVINRHDYGGTSAGLSARYEGQLNGNAIENGKFTWTFEGSTHSGTWKANW